ncbi:MAG: RNA ligase (ATP) [Ktedonobacterales bacterium]
MATFTVEVLPLTDVEPHPNADRLDLAVVGNYRVVVQKGQFRPNDLVAYIPEASLLPDDLIEHLNIRAYLAGPQHNRVRAAKLRGVLSQGLVVPARAEWTPGDDVAAELGITKWEPEIPLGMKGNPAPAPLWWQSYDVEAYNRYPRLLTEGEPVYVTEKVHGTCGLFGASEGEQFVSSKGMSDRHLVLKRDDTNIYWQAALRHAIYERIEAVYGTARPVQVFAEVYGTQTPDGRRIQDLTYNTALGLRIAVFEIAVDREFLPYAAAKTAARAMGLPFVPVLYTGPFEKERVLALAEGKETVSGTAAHLREGIVIRPEAPRESEEIGRVVLKYVGAAYLTRGGDATEYN